MSSRLDLYPFRIALLALAAIACSQPPAPEKTGPVVEPAPAPAVVDAQTPPDDGIPAGPAGERLRWYLSFMNDSGGEPITEAAYAEIFAPGFIAQVPPAKFNQIVAGLRQAAPFVLESIKDGATEHRLTAVVTANGARLGVYVSVTAADPHKIDGLLIKPEATALESWEQLIARLTAAGKHAQFLAARIDDRGRCDDVKAHDVGRHLAIGSAFKLYVLLALHERVARGKLRWDQPLAIRDDHKSLPSGVMQALAAGTKKPIEEYALKMISISDNTATDHLLYAIGRERVERAMKTARHSAPGRNRPFLSTREMFALKLNLDDEARAAYVAMPERKKRRFLERELDRTLPGLDKAAAWASRPLDIDTIEWFATPRDLCRAMAALRAASDSKTGAPLREVLSANPGVAVDKELWSWVGFKGGSEPGVMNLTWLLRHAGGGWYFFALTVNDPGKPLDEAAIAAIGQGALALFGAEVARPATGE